MGSTLNSARNKIYQVYKTLSESISDLHDWPQGEWPVGGCFQPNQLEIIVGAILTQNTSWRNVEKALKGMIRQNLTDVPSLAFCVAEELERAVYSAGFFRKKAFRIKEIAQFILDYPGDFYSHVQREELLAIEGIGPETADAILLYACGKTHFVVDAYTLRVFVRYGLLRSKPFYGEFKDIVHDCLPLDVSLYRHFHALIVEHAKQVCRKRPLCQACVLRTECLYARIKKRNQYGQIRG